MEICIFQLYNESTKQVKEEWKEVVKKGYVDCGNYMLKTLPLDNATIKTLSSLQPKLRGTEQGKKLMLQCSDLLPQLVASSQQRSLFDREVREYHVLDEVPPYTEGETRIDEWWASLRVQFGFKLLPKVALGLLTCFHGPLVEGSFSSLSHLVGPQSGRLSVQTMNALQTTRYFITN